MPSVAIQELNRDADQLFDILKLRNWHAAKQAYDNATDADERRKLLDDPTVKLIQELEFEKVRCEINARLTDD